MTHYCKQCRLAQRSPVVKAMPSEKLRSAVSPSVFSAVCLALAAGVVFGQMLPNPNGPAGVAQAYKRRASASSNRGVLAPQVTIGRYVIRPPKGFMMSQLRVKFLGGEGDRYVWEGPLRPDLTRPKMDVYILADNAIPSGKQQASAELAKTVMDLEHQNHTNVAESKVANVVIGGVSFAHGTWSGIGTSDGQPWSGDIYTRTTSIAMVSIRTADGTKYAGSTSSVLNASVNSFHLLSR